MANELLDFVMSLVRDPDAAAAYAANPAQAISDAHLTDVSSADVNHLIPVVSESLSMAGPSATDSAIGHDGDGNVWASGAATAAFDAFTDHSADAAFVDDPGSSSGVIAHAGTQLADGFHWSTAPVDTSTAPDHDLGALDDGSVHLNAPIADDPMDAPLVNDWHHAFTDVGHVDDGHLGDGHFDDGGAALEAFH